MIEGLPDYKVLSCKPEARSDGAVLLTIGRGYRPNRVASEFDAFLAIGQDGNIRWLHQMPFCLMDARLGLKHKTILVVGTDGRAHEIAFDGRVLQSWYTIDKGDQGEPGIKLPTAKLHHTIQEIAPDIYLSLSAERLPLTQPDDDWTHLMSDTVLCFDRKGTIRWQWSMAPLLDQNRMCYGSELPYWINQGYPRTRDWTHANCAIIDPTDGGILISCRHQDAVVKLTRRGELAWILGDPGGWREPWSDYLLKIDGERPPYHQHDLSFLNNGDLMLFDNGAAGAVPPQPEQPLWDRKSYAVSYKIDADTRRAAETSRYGGADLPYSHYVSGVCEMPNGNRFIACTGCIQIDGSDNGDTSQKGLNGCVFKEVTPEGEVVFHAQLHDPNSGPDKSWNGFRPEYLPESVATRLTST
ncbi:MAG: aryl-sulfate sulfotransferase [Pseudomonadota bacterium]